MIGSTNDTGRRIDTWMEAEAPLRAPVEILETVFATTSHASQRRPLPGFVGPRFGRSGRPLAIAFMALALLGLVIFGAVMVGGGRREVEPSPSPTAVPTPNVTAATIEARIPIPGAVPGMAFGSTTTADAVWVTSTLAVVRIDPTTNATLTVDVPDASAISGLAASAAGLFVADRDGNAVYRIDPASNTVVGRIEVVWRPIRDRRRRFVRLGPPVRHAVDRADRDRHQRRGGHIRGAGRWRGRWSSPTETCGSRPSEVS